VLDSLGLESRQGENVLRLFVQTGPGIHPASCSVGIGVISRGLRSRVVEFLLLMPV